MAQQEALSQAGEKEAIMAMTDWQEFYIEHGRSDKNEEQRQQFADYLAVTTLLRIDKTATTREALEAIYKKCPEIAWMIKGELEDMLLCP